MSQHRELAIMSRWYVVSRAIHIAARLDIANFMSDKPLSIDELAKRTATQAPLLRRLMDFLCCYEIFKKTDQGYCLTALSEALRDDDPNSIRATLAMVDESWWEAFAKLEDTLKTGQPAFEIKHQQSLFDFLKTHPDACDKFNFGMAKLSTVDDQMIVSAYPFSNFTDIVDLGGGMGGFCHCLAQQYSTISITLFDTATIVGSLDRANFPHNVTLKAGNFFEEIPPADGYILKGVLHDFNQEQMSTLLIQCARGLKKNGVLLIIEQVIPELLEPHTNRTMDIIMMVLNGGHQLTLSEWTERITNHNTGFYLQKTYKTKGLFTIMEFRLNA